MAERVAIIGFHPTEDDPISEAPSWRDDEWQMFEKLFMEPGVISGLAVTQRGAGANMSVDLATGHALIEITNTNLSSGETYKVYYNNTATKNIVVPAADPTNPRKDRIGIQIDVGDGSVGTANPNSAASNIGEAVLIEGTPAGSPSAPAEPDDFLTLYILDVPASDTAITTGQLTDSRTYATLDTAVLADVVRTTTFNTLVSDLLSTANAKGASKIGIEDAAGRYTSTNVEAALLEVLSLAAVTAGLYGNGADGVPTWTSGASLDPSTEKKYTTATLPVSQTLTVSSVNTPLIIHNTGDVTINGTVDLNAKGAAGGTAVSSDAAGNAGTAGNSLVSGWTTGAGAGGASVGGGSAGTGGGGGGASAFAAGTTGETGNVAGSEGGVGGTIMSASQLAFLAGILRGVVCGSGGGSGGRRSAGTSGAGGAGGGALVWYIGGSLTLGAASVIRANGANGSAGSGTITGGGGGGGGGTLVIVVAGSITNSGVTLSASAGSGGAAGHVDGGAGGAGAAGRAIIYSISTGTFMTA